MSKIIKRALVALVSVWLVGSVALSTIISINPVRGYDLLEYRVPFLVVEVATGQVTGFDQIDGQLVGEANGFFVGYGNMSSVKIGDTITSIFVYNPLNNYFDDIAERFDIDAHGKIWRA